MPKRLFNAYWTFDFPEYILTDGGSAFTSVLAGEFNQISRITPQFALPGQSDTMGSVEKSNQIMEDIIRKFINHYNQENWDEYVRLASYAINKAKSDTHGFAPDFLIFGKNQINQFIENEEHTGIKEYTEKFPKNLSKAIAAAKETLECYKKKMIDQVQKKLGNRKISEFKEGDKVYLKRPPLSITKELSTSLVERGMGPYQVNESDREKGNVKIQISPNTEIEVKNKDLRLAKDQTIDLEDLYQSKEDEPIILKPSKLNEVIILKDLREFPEKEAKREMGKIPKKGTFTVKTLVGKRENIEWKSGKYKGWHKGTIIGFFVKLSFKLNFL